MARRLLKPFTRQLDQEPTDHQRKFLYLPFPIFRDFTNIRSIVIDNHEKRKGKPPPEFVIKKTIEKHHADMSELDKWEKLNLDKLEFIGGDSKKVDAAIWSEPKETQQRIHRKFTDHEKQFAYLPLHTINDATNIRDLLSHLAKGNEKKLSFVVGEIHKQMARKYGRWVRELKHLRFVSEDETGEFESDNDEPEKDQATVNTKQTKKAVAIEPDPLPSTSKGPQIVRSPKSGAKTDSTPEPNIYQLRRRMSDLNRDEVEPPKKTAKVGTPTTKEGQQANDAKGKTKSVQSTLPTWLNKASRKKTVHEDLGLPKLPKLPKAPPKPTTPKRPQNEIMAKGLNTSLRKLIDDPSTSTAANDGNDVLITSSQSQQNGNVDGIESTAPTGYSKQSEDLLLAAQLECNAEDREKKRESYTPSEFQLEILQLSFDEFISKTNIKDIIQKDYREKKNDEKASLSDGAMHSRLEFYYDFRKRTREWHKNGIKNLKFIECECKRKSTGEQSRDVNNETHEKSNTKNQTKSSNQSETRFEPTEFQKEIMAMDFETFVNETNIRDLVTQDFGNQFKGSKRMLDTDMEFGLQQYDRFRKKPKKWSKNSLVHLRYKKCECKRNKKFEDKSVETDSKEVRDVEVQCCSVDFNTIVVHAADECQQSEPQHQPGTASLTLHGIYESQIIHVVYVSESDQELDQRQEQEQELGQETTQHITADVTMNEPENTTMLPPSQITPQTQGSTHYNSSQSQATGSSQSRASTSCTVTESQQVISLAEVRMSELIGGHPAVQTEDVLARDPFETQPAPENTNGDVSIAQDQEMPLPSQFVSPFEPQINSTPTGPSANEANTGPISQNDSEKPADNEMPTKIKIEPIQSSPVEQDSDLICLGDQIDPIYDVSDDSSLNELFIHMEESPNHEALVTVQTQPTPQEDVNRITSRSELINILAGGSPVIEDSESPSNNSPLRNIENIQPSVARPPMKEVVARKRPPTASEPGSKKGAKKRKVPNEDSLSTIVVPKYTYVPLNFIDREKTSNEATQSHEVRRENVPSQHEQSQSSSSNAPNYSIEDSSSADEANVTSGNMNHNNGMTTDSCAERAHLLNQDNTLFLNVNTQLMNSGGSSSSNQMNQVSQSIETDPIVTDVTTSNTNVDVIQTDAVVSLPKPGPSILSAINSDRTEFLHYVDITQVLSSLKSIVTESGNRGYQLDIKATLQHQCNGNNRIVVKGDALKYIMKLTDKEWNAVQSTLSAIETFRFESKSTEPADGSLLHRALYYLFKASSKISNVHIAYGDQDLETARVFYKPHHFNENITSAISPYILSQMKTKTQEQNK